MLIVHLVLTFLYVLFCVVSSTSYRYLGQEIFVPIQLRLPQPCPSSCRMSVRVDPVVPPVELGEGPHWDHREKVLYFVSIFDKTINRYDPATGKHTKSTLDDTVGFIVPVEDKPHHFVVGVGRKLQLVEWTGTTNETARVLKTLSEVDQDTPKTRLNDGKADPRGRLFAGTMGEEKKPGEFELGQGSLYRFDSLGRPTKVATGIDISNGMAWDVAAGYFYYADSFEYAIRQYNYDIHTGDISSPKIIFKYKDHGLEGIADGMTIDTDGNLWVANFDGRQMLKIDPKAGKILQKVPIPALQTTSATFGGDKLDELFVTSAKLNRGQVQPPPAGSTFRVTGLCARGHPNAYVKIDC